VAGDPVAKIAAELYNLIEPSTEQWASVMTLQSTFANSALQNETVQSIPPILVSVWNNYLTSDEQYIFFFKLMTRRQQARLWNGLVFPFNYFLNTDSARCRLNDMIKAVNFRTKKSIQDGQGDGRSIYTASVMRDLWRQMTGKPVNDFWDKLKLKDPFEKDGPRENELAEDQARQVCAFVEVISQTCKDLQNVLRGQKFTEQQLYTKYCAMLTEQKALGGKERLPLWLLMNPSHQVELIPCLNIDAEIGMLVSMIASPSIEHAEDCLNKHVFHKYSALVRVQAQGRSLVLTTKRMEDMDAGDASLLQYAMFLKERYLHLET
jgi:hypothetical protein